MAYKPMIITGKATSTGWPIDGHVLYFSKWDYDRDSWHLYGWDDEDDEAVMLTVWQTENEAGLSTCDTLEASRKCGRQRNGNRRACLLSHSIRWKSSR